MPNYDFDLDFPIAQKTERQVARILNKVYDAEILGFENTNKYDILVKIKGKVYKVEVKEDFTCEKTGNVGLEFSYRGRPSGIEVSQADLYVYKIHTQDGIYFYLHYTKTLKDMVAKGLFFRIVNGGDPGSNSLNYLFKFNQFIKGAILIAEIEKDITKST